MILMWRPRSAQRGLRLSAPRSLTPALISASTVCGARLPVCPALSHRHRNLGPRSLAGAFFAHLAVAPHTLTPTSVSSDTARQARRIGVFALFDDPSQAPRPHLAWGLFCAGHMSSARPVAVGTPVDTTRSIRSAGTGEATVCDDVICPIYTVHQWPSRSSRARSFSSGFCGLASTVRSNLA